MLPHAYSFSNFNQWCVSFHQTMNSLNKSYGEWKGNEQLVTVQSTVLTLTFRNTENNSILSSLSAQYILSPSQCHLFSLTTHQIETLGQFALLTSTHLGTL